MPARGETKSVGGKSYEWDGRRWVPASQQSAGEKRQPISTNRSRYSQGAPRPARDPEPAEESVANERTGREARRGSGVRGRGPEQPMSFSPTIRGRSGAQRAAGEVEAPEKPVVTPKTPPTPQAPESTSPTGRDETRTSPTGVEQTGTAMSGRVMTMDDANKILNRGGLEGKGYTVQNPFGSNQLPATSANPYFSDKSEYDLSQQLPEDMYVQEAGLNLTKNVFDAGSGVEYGQNLVQMPASGKIEYEQTAGAPLTVNSGTFKVTEANESAQQPEVNVDMARRRAFLDGDLNSMEALRAIEAQKGIVVTGNTYNVVNPNAGQEGESDFKKIDKAQRDTIMRGGEGAQNLLSSYTSAIKETGDAPTPRTDYSFDSPDVEDPDKSIRGTMADLPKGWRNS